MQAADRVAQLVRRKASSVEPLARAGYATRGFLYFIVGGLAALAAFGRGGDTTDSQGAITELYSQPFGQALVLLAAFGLFGYATFSAYQAVLDPEGNRQHWPVAMRLKWAAIALLHGGLGVYALRLGIGAPGSGGVNARSGTAELLAWSPPFGQGVVVLAGAGLLALALHQLWCSWRSKLDEQLNLAALQPQTRRWVVRFSRAGIAARAVVSLVTGAFLLVAALTSDAQQAKGFGESLAVLRETPLGAPLLGAVALGLVAFAFYQMVEAKYRRIE